MLDRREIQTMDARRVADALGDAFEAVAAGAGSAPRAQKALELPSR